jgi:hypothetical protein
MASGMGNLFQRLYARGARHTLVTGKFVTGPNVWLDVAAENQMADIGPHQRWATGLLFDNIHSFAPNAQAECTWGNQEVGLTVKFGGSPGTGHGWTGAQVMFWNNEAPLSVQAAPAAMSWAIGGIRTYSDDADPTCATGKKDPNSGACCPATCTQCGGAGCPAGPILANTARSCLEFGPPCFQPDPTCRAEWGKLSSDGQYCCPKSCTQCGGSGAAPECRVTGITAACTDHPPRCRMDQGHLQLTTTTVEPRSLYLAQLAARLGKGAVENVTTAQQRQRRIWDDILRWKGNGKLETFTADPTCETGTPDADSTACCPSTCSDCGGEGLPAECRARGIILADNSCLGRGPPCNRPNPTCDPALSRPSADGMFCCPKWCTSCGGSGQPVECRTGGLTRSCAEFGPPCKMVDPTCTAGVEGRASDSPGRACCSANCSQCGGSGCAGAGHPDDPDAECCMTGILSSGDSCTDAIAPCLLD